MTFKHTCSDTQYYHFNSGPLVMYTGPAPPRLLILPSTGENLLVLLCSYSGWCDNGYLFVHTMSPPCLYHVSTMPTLNIHILYTGHAHVSNHWVCVTNTVYTCKCMHCVGEQASKLFFIFRTEHSHLFKLGDSTTQSLHASVHKRVEITLELRCMETQRGDWSA